MLLKTPAQHLFAIHFLDPLPSIDFRQVGSSAARWGRVRPSSVGLAGHFRMGAMVAVLKFQATLRKDLQQRTDQFAFVGVLSGGPTDRLLHAVDLHHDALLPVVWRTERRTAVVRRLQDVKHLPKYRQQVGRCTFAYRMIFHSSGREQCKFPFP